MSKVLLLNKSSQITQDLISENLNEALHHISELKNIIEDTLVKAHSKEFDEFFDSKELSLIKCERGHNMPASDFVTSNGRPIAICDICKAEYES